MEMQSSLTFLFAATFYMFHECDHISSCRFSSSPFCRLNRSYFLDFWPFLLLFFIYFLTDLFWNTMSVPDTVYQTKVYGESTRITPCVLHRTLSLYSQCHVCLAFLLCDSIRDSWSACDLLYLQHAILLFNRTAVESTIPHFVFWSWLPQLCIVFVFIPIELYSVCIRCLLWILL